LKHAVVSGQRGSIGKTRFFELRLQTPFDSALNLPLVPYD
jgi:hypothetical protein